jgi:hypothetical protein
MCERIVKFACHAITLLAHRELLLRSRILYQLCVLLQQFLLLPPSDLREQNNDDADYDKENKSVE